MKVDETIYKNYFYKKVLFLLFFGILSLMLLVSFGTFYIYFRYYMNALADSSLQNSAYVCSNLDNYLQDVTLTTDDMYIDSQIHQLLTHPDQGNQALFQKYYSRHKFSNPYFICQIELFDFWGNRYVYYNSAALTHSFLSDAQTLQEKWLTSIKNAGGRIVWIDGREVSPKASHLLFAMRLIKNANANQPIGVAVVSILKRSVSDNLSSYASSTTQIYLTDAEGKIVLEQTVSQAVSDNSAPVLDMALVSGPKGYYTSFSESLVTVYSLDAHTGWYVVQVTQMPTFPMFLKQLSGSLPIIFVIVLIVAALFSWFLYRTVSRPILMLVECMRSLETLDFAPPDLDITRTDELGYLNRSYLLLLDELNRLFQSLVQEQNAKKNAELEALRAQINPHFLYNTLTAVRFLVDMQHNQSASEVLISLIKLLKINLDTKREMLTVEEELEYLRNYLLIQRHRYDNFEVYYDVDAQALPCLIPRLLIQPLVENSLFHGLKNGSLHGCIYISIQRKKTLLSMQVRDNGCGFPQNFDLFAPNPNSQRFSVSIGLNNVNERLRLRYGTEAMLHIENASGGGACISFEIPVEE